MSDCVEEKYSSRMCEKGTKGCNVQHKPSDCSESALNDLLCCEDCGKKDDTVRNDTCPYAEEINDSIIDIVICPNCYHERCMDI